MDGTIDEKRVYAERTGAEEVFVAAEQGLVVASLSGDRVGEFGLDHRAAVRDVATDGERRVVATDSDVLVGDYESTGFGPAVAVGFDDGAPLAAGADGRIARLDDGWTAVGRVTDPRAVNGGVSAAESGVHQVVDGDLRSVGLGGVNDVHGRGTPLAATDDGLYRLGNGWMVVRDGAFTVVSAAADGRAHAVGDEGVLARAAVDDWRPVETPTDDPVDVTYTVPATVAVTETGTLLADAGDGWRARELGITGLRDLATVCVWPDDQWDRRATSYVNPRPRDPELVTEILRETEVSNLMDLAQIAHRFLREIDPSYADEWEAYADTAGPWSNYLIGTGRNLPDDDPPENFSLEYPRKSLVRVYPYVQYDYVRNRVAFLAAKVTSTRYEESNGGGVFISAHPAELITPSDFDKNREERRLLEEFFHQLNQTVEEVRPDLSVEGYSEEVGFLHIYPYGNSQNQSLLDAVKRHPESEAAQALRTLLGYREEIDQEVVSVLRDEFRERHAFRYPGLGLVQTAAQFYSAGSKLDWESPRDPDVTPLKQVFDLDFFETAVPYEELSDRILMQFDGGLQIPPDNLRGYYPVLGRHQEVLPLEYLYATEEFDIVQPDWADDDEMRRRIVRYRHHHEDESSPRVTLDDIDDAGGGAILTMEDGTFVTVDCTPSREYWSGFLRLLGTEGKLTVDEGQNEWRYWSFDGTGHTERALPDAFDGGKTPDLDETFPAAAAHVVDLLDGGVDNLSPGAEATHVTEILTGVFLSSYTNSHVSLPLDRPLRDVTIRSW
jgi:hypothetical protein